MSVFFKRMSRQNYAAKVAVVYYHYHIIVIFVVIDGCDGGGSNGSKTCPCPCAQGMCGGRHTCTLPLSLNFDPMQRRVIKTRSGRFTPGT